ncbi:MAG: peptidylprolyl isomerase [Zoogloeaceae bacterium]|jgi:peptidyl-prolyl cis-trans isomerase C|nr:peptidylprolyl isomerase [Zoogloeaceae bacterium]
MTILKKLAVALTVGTLFSLPALAAEKAFVTVNGRAVPQYVADAFIEDQQQGAPDSEEFRNAVREEFIRRELIIGEARKKGLDKKKQVMGQLENARQMVLVRAYLTEYLRENPITDAQINEAYTAFTQRLGDTEYKTRHILVESEAEARELVAKLDKGGRFEDLAKGSKDPGSNENGGDLGWMSPSAFVAPFAEALSRLKKGEYSKDPVQSQFGYHVILVEDTRALTPPALEQVKPQITQTLTQQKVEALLNTLRSKAKIN